MSPRMSMRSAGALSLVAAVFGIALSGTAHACIEKEGEKLLSWVMHDAARQSLALARADYEARTFNYALLGYDEVHRRAEQLSKELDAIHGELEKSEAARITDSIALAAERERNSTELLNRLFRARTELDEIERRHARLTEPASRAAFEFDGLQNVGRATLLSSLQELGDPDRQLLGERYGVYMEVSASETGDVDAKAHPQPRGQWYDVVAYALTQVAEDSIPLYAFYISARAVIDDEVCRHKIKEQRARAKKALQLLPSKLIQPDAQYTLYAEIHARNLAAFAEHSTRLGALRGALNERWKQLFAYNASRAAVARSLLTTATVARLRSRYGADVAFRRIYEQIVPVTEAAEEVGRLTDYLARQQLGVLTACQDTKSYLRVEDQLDALHYGTASLELLRGQEAFAPLQKLLESSLREIEQMREEAQARSQVLGSTSCPAKPALPLRKAAVKSKPLKMQALRVAMSSPAMTEMAPAGVGYCRLGSGGGPYACVKSPNVTTYDAFFSPGGDPRQGVFLSSGDGGFRVQRRTASRVEQASRNIEERIRQTAERSEAARAALPEWQRINATALGQQVGLEQARSSAEQQRARDFGVRYAGEVGAARAEIERFLSMPDLSAGAGVLMGSIGVPRLSLPELPARSVPVDAPRISRMTAQDRAYGTVTAPSLRRVLRERERVSADLAAHDEHRAVANWALETAERFASGGPEAEALAEDLSLDAAALRYHASGRRSTLDVAVVDSAGRRSRVPVSGPAQLPRGSVLERTRDFEEKRLAYEADAAAVRAATEPNAPGARQRVALTGVSVRVASLANSTFYSGHMNTGSQLLAAAHALLDLATSLTPGIGWGRDIYEAITGKDLLTDEPLDSFGRTAAVVGMVSAGFGDDAFDLFRAIKKISDAGESADTAEKIAKGARRMALDTVDEEGLHITEEALKDSITNDEWNALFEEGVTYFDRAGRNIAVSLPSREVFTLPNGQSEVFEYVVAIVDPLKVNNGQMKGVTVYRERRALEDIVDSQGARRFIRLFDEKLP